MFFNNSSEEQNKKIITKKDKVLEFLESRDTLPTRNQLHEFLQDLWIDKDNFLTQVFGAIKEIDTLNQEQVEFLESKNRYYLYQYYFTPWALTQDEKWELENLFFSQVNISQITSNTQQSVSQTL